MFTLNNKPLGLDIAFTVEDGTQYPANWLRLASPEERAAIGITEIADPDSYDDRFYWSASNPKQLDDLEVVPENGEPYIQKGLKSQWSSQVKDTTNKLLSSSDWMVIRKVERNVDIPAGTITYRAAVLTECDRLLAAIQSVTTVNELADVASAQNWPESNK